MMKIRIIATLALVTLVACFAANAQATTFTFAENIEGNLPGNNNDVNEFPGPNPRVAADNYGSNVAAESAGFTTTDGTGATPNIGITWGPLHDVRANVWEFHGSGVWGSLDALGSGGPYVQIDVDNTPSGTGFPDDPTIEFTVPAGVQVDIHGLDLAIATNYSGDLYSWTVDVVRVSDGVTVDTQSTIDIPIGAAVHLDIDFLGDVGESYRLKFDDGGRNHFSTAMDNLSFSQIGVPEPTSLALVALCGLVGVSMRRRS